MTKSIDNAQDAAIESIGQKRENIPSVTGMIAAVLKVVGVWLILFILNRSNIFHFPQPIKNLNSLVITIFAIYLIFFFLKKKKYSITKSLQLNPVNMKIMLVTLLLVLGIFAVRQGLNPILYNLFPSKELIQIYLDSKPKTMLEWVHIIASAILVAPVLEELIFRGLMQKSLNEKYGLLISIMVPAIIFSIIHIFPVAILSILFSSVIYGLLVYKTQSVHASIIAHAFHNLIALIYNSLFFKELPTDIKISLFSSVFPILIGIGILIISFRYLGKSAKHIS